MCRSIQTLRDADPPATADEVRAAALQYVRKISGYRTPSARNRDAFDAAVTEITAATERLLDGLVPTGRPPAAAAESLARVRAARQDRTAPVSAR